MNYSVSSTSLAHTFGNVTSFATDYIKTLFPANYFRTVHISSSIAYKQIKSFKNKNSLEFLKKNKPMLIIKPRVDLLDEDVYQNGTFLTSRITDNMLGDVESNNHQPFIVDDKNKYRVNYLLNRVKVLFDVVLVFETPMEQMNMANYFRNIVRQNRPFFLNTYLESHVPKETMQGVSQICGIPMYDEKGSTKKFLDYVNKHSVSPVTYKLKNSSGNDEFFRFYNVSIDTILTNLSIDDNSKRGFVSDMNTMSFTVSTEFYTSGLYYLFSHNKVDINQIIFDNNGINRNGSEEIVPMITVSDFYKNSLPNGWKLFSSNIFKVESNTEPDKLDLNMILSEHVLHFIDDHVSKGIPVESFLEIRVYKDTRRLREISKEYKVDYVNLTVTTNVLNTYSSYRILAYVNTRYINDLADEVLGLSDER